MYLLLIVYAPKTLLFVKELILFDLTHKRNNVFLGKIAYFNSLTEA